ncbi:MAG: hypothetical protein M3O30_17015 [Planctomycetota bacterium]|nr:hypothetical protein [Planctomycetota bacterium]
MTIPQALHALGVDPSAPQQVSTAQAAEIAEKSRAKIFDKIIKQNRWLPSDLLLIPSKDLQSQIQQHNSGAPVEPAALPAQIECYITHKQQEGA